MNILEITIAIIFIMFFFFVFFWCVPVLAVALIIKKLSDTKAKIAKNLNLEEEDYA